MLITFLLVSRQWGRSYETKQLTLPITADLIALIGMHEGLNQQIVTYSLKTNTWIGTNSGNLLFYIAICK